MRRRTLRAGLLCAPLAGLLLAGCATLAPSGAGESFDLGQNAAGDACNATATWADPAQAGRDIKFANVYSINCRRQQTASALGRVRVFDSAAALEAFAQTLSCGPAQPAEIPGFTGATAQRCQDPGVGLTTVLISGQAGGRFFQISVAPNAVGAGVQAARLLAGLDAAVPPSSAGSYVNVASLAPAPAAAATLASATDAESTLQVGTNLNFRGLHADASRYLNNALAALRPNTPPQIVAEMTLEAALADSNIRFFDSATRHFAGAERLIAQSSNADQQLLRKKLTGYRGLDALNRRDFPMAQELLATLPSSAAGNGQSALIDPSIITQLNQSPAMRRDIRNALSLPDGKALRELALDSQAAWALSVSALAQDNVAVARTALAKAYASYNILENSPIQKGGVLWLGARLDRQAGRLAAADGDFRTAIANFDSAIRKLTRSSVANAGTGAEPAIAELQLERAGIVSRSGAAAAQVTTAYEQAIDALVLARDTQPTFVTTPLQPYLERLIAAGTPEATRAFFRAMQVTSESGAARQLSQLQDIATSRSEGGARLREVQDLSRQLSELNLAIQEAAAAGQPTDKLRETQGAVQQRYVELDAQVLADTRLNSVSDRPASLADVQAILRDGESYVKFTEIGNQLYGIVVGKDRARPFRVLANVPELARLISEMRQSIDGSGSNRISEFRVLHAATVYQALFGPIASEMAATTSLVVDGGNLLGTISPGILVADVDSATRFARQKDRFDYREVDFLARRMPISVAISPRSFVASRNLAPSQAPRPLLGFADPRPVSAISTSDQTKVGPCRLQPAQLLDLSNRFVPIPDTEIRMAARALGLADDATIVSGGTFSDSAVLDRGASGGDLSQYRVVHFATHGVTEGQFGCQDSPAALLTSLGTGGSDMLLSFDEIAKLRLDANLVVLSACETASTIGERALRLSGQAQPGGSLEGLVRAFFSADARAVMATYWQISAEGETLYFMDQFYSAGRTATIGSALQQAQAAMIARKEYSHPRNWGAFFVVGDSTRNMLAGSGSALAPTPSAMAN